MDAPVGVTIVLAVLTITDIIGVSILIACIAIIWLVSWSWTK